MILCFLGFEYLFNSRFNIFNFYQEVTTLVTPDAGYNEVMSLMVKIDELVTKETPREILKQDFKIDFPISGGWGYTRDQAVVIDKYDKAVNQEEAFDGVGIEYKFVEKRIYEEMIVFMPKGERYSGIGWKLVKQNLINTNNRNFDKLTFSISALLEKDFDLLKKEMEDIFAKDPSDKLSIEKNLTKKAEKTITIIRDFWFDITSFYNQGLVITDKKTGKKILLKTEDFTINLPPKL